MVKKELMIITADSEERLFSLEELCGICDIGPDYIFDLIEYDIIRLSGHDPEKWIFNLSQLQRIKTVQRVQYDLEINLAGAALILELLDEIERLRSKAALVDRYFL